MNEIMSNVKKKYLNYIDQIITNNKISHTYLIEIDDFNNDYFYISLFIKMILLNKISKDVMNDDNNIIKMIDDNDYPDLKIIEPEGSYIKKHQLLELQKEFNNTSLLNGKRFYIIKDSDKLNVSSGNTILKFLEEPVDNVIAFLVTSNRYLVLETILSRCQVLSLKENYSIINYDDYNLDVLECFLRPKKFFLRYRSLLNDLLFDKDVTKKLFLVTENIIIMYINYLYMPNLVSISEDIVNTFSHYDVNVDYLLSVISELENHLALLDYNVNYKLWLDSLFSKLIIGGVSL